MNSHGASGVRLLTTCLLVTLTGCGGPADPDLSVAASVTFSSSTSALSLSFSSLANTHQLTATVTDQNGDAIGGASVTWKSSAPFVATVSATGLVTAVANGTATITATSGNAAGTVPVTVEQIADVITLSPNPVILAGVGDTVTVTAIVLDAGGSEIAGLGLTWSSDDPSIATVSSTGLVTAVANGLATVTVEVTSGGQTATQALSITVALSQVVLQPGEFCSDHPDTAIATFEDGGLEGAVRIALSVGAQENLTCGLISGLTVLNAVNQRIRSLAGVQNLTGLTRLDLRGNPILSDITELSALTELTFLHLGGNSITEIGALMGLTSLTELDLTNNADLSNIQPLVDNTGLGTGDMVDVRSTSVSCTDAAALQRKGVNVLHSCL